MNDRLARYHHSPLTEMIEYQNGKWRLSLDSAPSFCMAIDPDPSSEFVASGEWLILCVAVWSTPDRNTIDQAIEIVGIVDQGTKLGILLFESHQELHAWNENIRTRWESPVWLSIRDGRLLEEHTGLTSNGALTKIVQRLIER